MSRLIWEQKKRARKRMRDPFFLAPPPPHPRHPASSSAMAATAPKSNGVPHVAPDKPTLYIKGNWPLSYTFERINQALHRDKDDPIDKTSQLSICGIGKAINTVAILHNVIQDKRAKGAEWNDYTIQNLGTATVSNTEKPRTQLSFTLTRAAGEADSDSEA